MKSSDHVSFTPARVYELQMACHLIDEGKTIERLARRGSFGYVLDGKTGDVVTDLDIITVDASREQTIYQCKTSVKAIRGGLNEVRTWCEAARRYIRKPDFRKVKYIMPCSPSALPQDIRDFMYPDGKEVVELITLVLRK